MRILHLVSTFEVKTDTKWLYRLLGRLDRSRFESAIACFYEGGLMMERFSALGMPAFNFNVPGRASPAALGRVLGLIRAYRPQVVHTHLLRADLYGGLAARLAGVPVVLSTAYALGDYRRDKVRRVDDFLDRVCRRLATDLLAVSEAVREDRIRRLRWPSDRVHTIHTGIEFPATADDGSARTRIRHEWGIPDRSPLVLAVARLSYEKGIDILIEAAAAIHRQLPAARFVVVGDGPLRDNLVVRIRSMGIEGVVQLAGFREDVETVLPAGDLFVMPSLMEGMPNALLEAHVAGLPVVASSVGGLAEAIEHERSGLLVPPRDPAALAAAIVRILNDEPLRRRLAHDGREFARQRFAVELVARRYEDLYEKLYRARCARPRYPDRRRVNGDPVPHTR